MFWHIPLLVQGTNFWRANVNFVVVVVVVHGVNKVIIKNPLHVTNNVLMENKKKKITVFKKSLANNYSPAHNFTLI